MDRLTFLVLFIPLLLVPLKSAGEDHSDGLDILAELVDSDLQHYIGDSDFEGEALDSMYQSGHANKVLVNVNAFGAAGDGVSDDTQVKIVAQAFVNAWGMACSASNSVLLVPENGRYLVNATRFKGPCAGKITIQIDGNIIAPADPKQWDPSNPRTWLGFYNLSKATFKGQGVIDGTGSQWWADSIQNGQQMNFIISRSDSVRVTGVQVSAPGDSPNTDGIHITASTNVVLQNFPFAVFLNITKPA